MGLDFPNFWQLTGEEPFGSLAESFTECYRLTINASLGHDYRVIRLQRPVANTAVGSELVAHFGMFDGKGKVSADTFQIALAEDHWQGLRALLAVAGFWQLPARSDRAGLDGATYTLEASEPGRRHTVERWSPNCVVSGGELFCVATDYLQRLGELASYKCELYKRYG